MEEAKRLRSLRDQAAALTVRLQRGARVAEPVRRLSWPRRGLRIVLGLLVITGSGLAITELVTPEVGGAPARVAAFDALHRSHPVNILNTDRIAIATVAAEDERFYTHHGIDSIGVLRAAWGGITGVDLGGSTLDQQLAKNVYSNADAGFLAGIRDAAIALKLEGHYTKTAILSMYVDAVYYGHGYYGIAAASMGYFGVNVDQLTWGQAALLAGLPQAPSLLDPFHNPGAARQREDYVLGRLAATGKLTEAAADAAATAPIALRAIA